MEAIELDGATWAEVGDFYAAYFAAVGAPDWHGRNLDALWDSLTGGDINERNPPLQIRILRTAQMSKEAREIVGRFEKLVQQARNTGVPVQIEVLP